MLKKYRPSLTGIILIIALILVVFLYRNRLHALILVPIAYVIFIFRLITTNVHQAVLWISFVVVTSIIALISLGLRWEPEDQEKDPQQKFFTRLHTWAKTVQRKKRSEYFKWNLAQDLSNLFIEAVAYRQGISRAQVLEKLKADKLDLPPDIQAYLQISQQPFTQTGLDIYTNGNWLSRIWEFLKIRTNQGKAYIKSPLDLEPQKIIHYLETYLDLDPEIWEV